MNWMRIRLLAGLMVLCLGTAAYAGDSTPTAWGPVSATFGPCGLSMPAGKLAVGGNLVYGNSNGLWRHDRRLNGNTKATKLNEVFKTRYGIWDGLDIRTATPIYNVHLEKTNTDNRDIYGIGDSTVLLHQRLFNQRAGDPLSVALDFGAVLPTGSVSQHSSDLAGNSSWGAVVGLGGTYFLGANRFDSEVNYAMFTEGAHDYERGDRFRWNLGYAYALTDSWSIGVESTFETYAESRKHGEGQSDASLEWYAGPKVAYKIKPWKTSVGVILKAPVKRWYEGTKAASDDYRVELKLMKTFDLGTLFD